MQKLTEHYLSDKLQYFLYDVNQGEYDHNVMQSHDSLNTRRENIISRDSYWAVTAWYAHFKQQKLVTGLEIRGT